MNVKLAKNVMRLIRKIVFLTCSIVRDKTTALGEFPLLWIPRERIRQTETESNREWAGLLEPPVCESIGSRRGFRSPLYESHLKSREKPSEETNRRRRRREFEAEFASSNREVFGREVKSLTQEFMDTFYLLETAKHRPT